MLSMLFSLKLHFCTTLSNERDPSSQAHCINDRDTFSKFIWRLSKIDDFCCFTERCLTYFPSLFFLIFHFSTTLSRILAIVIFKSGNIHLENWCSRSHSGAVCPSRSNARAVSENHQKHLVKSMIFVVCSKLIFWMFCLIFHVFLIFARPYRTNAAPEVNHIASRIVTHVRNSLGALVKLMILVVFLKTVCRTFQLVFSWVFIFRRPYRVFWHSSIIGLATFTLKIDAHARVLEQFALHARTPEQFLRITKNT